MPVLTRTKPDDADQVQLMPPRPRKGVTALEYLMMLSLIIVVCLAAIGYLGTTNGNNMSTSSSKIGTSLKKGS